MYLFCCSTAYNTILELDKLLTKTESECIPEGFRNPSLSDLAEKPYLHGAYTEIQIRRLNVFVPNSSVLMNHSAVLSELCWLRSILHRPYLLQKLPKAGETDHYANSRNLAVGCKSRFTPLAARIQILNPPHNSVPKDLRHESRPIESDCGKSEIVFRL